MDYQRGVLGRVVDTLPSLIETAQQLEDVASHPTNDTRACWAVSVRTYHLAATTLSKIGEADLAWIAAECAMHAADQADDPLVLASAARAGTHALLAVGPFEDALNRGSTAADWLSPQVAGSDPNALSLYGDAPSADCVAAARLQDRRTAIELLNRAHIAAEQLGVDANYWQTGFGSTNVQLHRLSAVLDLEDVDYVVDRGPGVDVDHLPTERGVSPPDRPRSRAQPGSP